MHGDSSLPTSRAGIPPGTRLNGIYEIDVVIGAGGMGEIYKGHNIQTQDVVAIKLMLPELAENEAAMALFRKEASALHSLLHDAIVRYYVFTVEPVLQRPYLAMEFVEGQPLSELLKRGPLTLEAVDALKRRVATGLQAAHERGVIHRDVSPDNIIIPSGDVGRAKIIDFGIARSTQMGDGTIIGGGFAGKYNYVSPEQLGLYGGNVTGRSDIYSLGLLLAEALTGQPINMGGSQVDVIEKRRRVPDLGAIDLRMRPLLEKMLQPDPADRPESMAAVAAWQIVPVRGLESPRGRDARAEIGAHRAAVAAAGPGRGKVAAWAAVVAVVLLAGAGGGYYTLSQRGGSLEPPTPSLRPVTSASSQPPGQQMRPSTSPLNSLQSEPAPTLPSGGGATPVDRPLTPNAQASGTPQQNAPEGTSRLTPASPSATVNAMSQNGSPAVSPSRPPTPQLQTQAPSSIPPVAMLPPSPAPESTPSAPSADPASKIVRYISDYQGGDCFFITPVAVTANSAKIDGYGASVAPFEALDRAFKRSNGFEADIGVREVTRAQCPAITFLSRIRNNRSPAPRLQVAETNLKSGQPLTGTLDGYGDRHVELLLVADDGSVLNLSRLLKPASTGKRFNLRMQRNGAPGAQPQLLIAVASAKPLDTLKPRGAVEADLFFPLVIGEASQAADAITATAKYFKLDR